MNGKNRIPRRDNSRSGRVWKNQQWQQDDAKEQDAPRQPEQQPPYDQAPNPQDAAGRVPKRDYDYDYDYEEPDEHRWNREGANVGNPKIYSDQNPSYGGNYNRQKSGGYGGGGGNQSYQRRSSYQPRQQQYDNRPPRDNYRDSHNYENRQPRDNYRSRGGDYAGGRDRDRDRDRDSYQQYDNRAPEPRPRRMIKRRPPGPGPAQPSHRGGGGGGGYQGESRQYQRREGGYQQDRQQDRRGGGDHQGGGQQGRHPGGGQQARHQNQRFQKPRKPQITRKEAQKNFQKKRRNLQIVSLPRAMAKLQFGSRNITIDFIRNSRVSVNNAIVSDPNKRVILFKDRVAVDYMPLKANRSGNFVVLHKPAGLVPSKEPNVRTVHSLVPNSEHWYFPAGRLSKAMSGLVITTNDEAHRNSDASEFNALEKEYHVKVNRVPKRTEITALNKALRALHDDNGKETKAAILQKNKRSCWLSIIVKRGGVTDINKVLKSNDLEVLSMHRFRIGTLTTDTIKEGSWKQMNEIELAELLGHDTTESSYFYQRPTNSDADDEHDEHDEDMDDMSDEMDDVDDMDDMEEDVEEEMEA